MLVQTAYAQDTFINFILMQDERGINIADRTVSTAKSESENEGLGDYKLILRNAEGGQIYERAFSFADNVAIVSAPVLQDTVKGEIYDSKNNLLKEADITHLDLRLCSDSICSGTESYQTCPQDCPSGSIDNYCDGVNDGVCDSDCIAEQDADCNREGLKETQLSQGKSNLIFYLLVFIIFVIIFLLVYKNKPKKYVPESEQQLKDFIKEAKKSGQSREEIKNQLLAAGWPEDLIDKYLDFE